MAKYLHLRHGYPADREAFRQATDFHPPTIPTTTRDQRRLTRALVSAPALGRSPSRARGTRTAG
jgi:hypothetical protein